MDQQKGRPKKAARLVNVTHRTDPEVWQRFVELAHANGTTASNLIRTFIEGYANRHDPRPPKCQDWYWGKAA